MKKWFAVLLAVIVPAIAFASTASRLGVYTTDNVPGMTHGFTDQFGNFSAPVDVWKGGTSGSINLQPEATAAGTAYIANPALVATGTSLSITSTTVTQAIPGFSYTLSPSATYNVHLHIQGSNNNTGGISLTTSGTSSLANNYYTALVMNGTSVGALANSTTLNTALSSSTTFTDAFIDGTLATTATGGGTLNYYLGQVTSNATALTLTTTASQMSIYRVK